MDDKELAEKLIARKKTNTQNVQAVIDYLATVSVEKRQEILGLVTDEPSSKHEEEPPSAQKVAHQTDNQSSATQKTAAPNELKPGSQSQTQSTTADTAVKTQTASATGPPDNPAAAASETAQQAPHAVHTDLPTALLKVDSSSQTDTEQFPQHLEQVVPTTTQTPRPHSAPPQMEEHQIKAVKQEVQPQTMHHYPLQWLKQVNDSKS